MRIDILTVFPEMFAGPMDTSILGRAKDKGILNIRLHNIRDYSESKHKNTDDYPFGGGAGMVMMAQPIFSCLEDVDPDHEALRIAMAPRGKTLSVPVARELAAKDRLLFLCGHYEGVDERALELVATDYLSIGDYVLTGGELPAMVMIDCISRLVPGVLNNDVSAEFESFHDNLLEYPQYSRPEEWHGKKVPEVLMSGHHANIEKWRREQSIYRTAKRRPDLLKKAGIEVVSSYRAYGKEHIEIAGGGKIEFRTKTSKGGLGETS